MKALNYLYIGHINKHVPQLPTTITMSDEADKTD